MIRLGSITFSDFAIPDEVTFGGEQRLVVHELVGGTRIIDAMGRSDLPIIWRGLLWGQTAEATAKTIDAYRIAGKQLPLAFNGFSYTVVLRNAEFKVLKPWMVEYRISCEVVHEGIAKGAFGLDAAIFGDWQAANDFFADLANNPIVTGMQDLWSQISGYMDQIKSIMAQVEAWQQAALSTVQSILAPIRAAQFAVLQMISRANGVIATVGTVGGIIPGGKRLLQGEQLLTQVGSMTALPTLHGFDNSLSRMGTNIGNASGGASSQQVTVTGGTLYGLAAQYYGDASQWTTIARANKMTDPAIAGTQTLTIPPKTTGTGGVLTP